MARIMEIEILNPRLTQKKIAKELRYSTPSGIHIGGKDLIKQAFSSN